MSLLDLQGMAFRSADTEGGRSTGAPTVSSRSVYECNFQSNLSASVGLCQIGGI